MKVAIIGAGISGLACAHELEKYGIKPVIYERNHSIGQQFPNVASNLEIIDRPIKDPIGYMKKELGIEIKPLNTIHTLIHHSKNKKNRIKGNFGYLFKRGKEIDSVSNQIYSKLKNTKIIFNQFGDYEDLSKKYDYVVIANGNPNFAEEMGCWYDWMVGYAKGAIVLGDFDPNTIIMWINKDYCKNGYATLIPFSKNKASLVLNITDVVEKQVESFWALFLYTEDIEYRIVEEFKFYYKSGYAYPHQIRNLFFIGNAGGGTDSFLGLGQLNGMKMGVMAARAIAKGKDYEKLIEDVVEKNKHLYNFRRSLNKLTNKDYDLLISSIGLPGIKHLLYDSNLNVVDLGGKFLSLMKRP